MQRQGLLATIIYEEGSQVILILQDRVHPRGWMGENLLTAFVQPVLLR